MRPPKRIDLLLQTFAAMRSRRPSRLLILAGGAFAPYEEMLRRRSRLRDRVVVKENVTDVEDYLAAADAGLYTSESESFGLSILETLFHAKPVVAFRVGGIPEVVRGWGDRISASVWRYHSRWRLRWIGLADDPELAQGMGEEGRRQARAEILRGPDRAALRGGLRSAGGLSSRRCLRLPGEFEEQHLASGVVRVIKLHRAILPDLINRDGEARTPAVNLMHPGVRANIEIPPRFRANRTPGFLDQERFEQDGRRGRNQLDVSTRSPRNSADCVERSRNPAALPKLI